MGRVLENDLPIELVAHLDGVISPDGVEGDDLFHGGNGGATHTKGGWQVVEEGRGDLEQV